jgi:hypothetical protein
MMSPSRFQQIWNGTTHTARKIYDKVPIQEEWPIKLIYAELTRTGTALAYNTVSGCLESLRSSGLIRESRNGFKRELVRQAEVFVPLSAPVIQHEETPMNSPVVKPAPAPAPATQSEIVDSLGRLAMNLTAMAIRLQKETSALAEQINNTALELQARVDIDSEDLDKLHTMRALLKNL